MDRVIFHCDLNSFYASVELLSHPELRHLPVAVCGDPESRHGIILAKNEPAKSFGVKTARGVHIRHTSHTMDTTDVILTARRRRPIWTRMLSGNG